MECGLIHNRMYFRQLWIALQSYALLHSFQLLIIFYGYVSILLKFETIFGVIDKWYYFDTVNYSWSLFIEQKLNNS